MMWKEDKSYKVGFDFFQNVEIVFQRIKVNDQHPVDLRWNPF
jgi:hypothetical protein